MGCSQVAPSWLTPPRERTPKPTHLPLLKFPCSNAPEPESPSHVLSPDTNSPAVRTCFAVGSLKQSKLGSFASSGMQRRSTFSLIRRIPAEVPAVSVGVSTP